MNDRNTVESFSRRNFISRTFIGAALLSVPLQLFKQYETKADENGNDVILRFSTLSDVHFKISSEAQEVDRFRRSIEFMYEYSEKQKYPYFDAMLVAGDVSDHGHEEELVLFRKVMDEGIRKGTETILCMGNHEFISGTRERWERIFDRDANKVHNIKGFTFIALSPEKGTSRDGDFKYALEWFANEVDKAVKESPEKPLFTFQHYHVTPTVYGSRGEDNWGIRDLYDTLQQYPQVINFSGHSHYPINDPRSAWQGVFTAFGTGTLSYFEMGSEGGRYSKFPKGYDKAAQMYVVEVRKDNSVTLKPYDLITNTFFDVVYYVQPGKIESYQYTDARAQNNEKPIWSDNAKLTFHVDKETDSVELVIPQATCKDLVHSYRIETYKQKIDEMVDDEFDVNPQYIWSEYYFKDQPQYLRAPLFDLPNDTRVRIMVTALNPWLNESEKKLEAEFTTPKYLLAPIDPNAEYPVPNMLSFAVVDGKPVNLAQNGLKTQKLIHIDGKPVFERLSGTEQEVASFNGQDQRLKVDFTSRDYAAMSKMTIAASFLFDKFSKDNQSILSNTEHRGVSLEINHTKKTLEFWASINGSYTILSAPIQEGRIATAFGVYDGMTMRLYVDGILVASTNKKGRLLYPTEKEVQAFCIGSDIAAKGGASNYFKGAVIRAQVFSWALNEKQIQNLSRKYAIKTSHEMAKIQ